MEKGVTTLSIELDRALDRGHDIRPVPLRRTGAIGWSRRQVATLGDAVSSVVSRPSYRMTARIQKLFAPCPSSTSFHALQAEAMRAQPCVILSWRH